MANPPNKYTTPGVYIPNIVPATPAPLLRRCDVCGISQAATTIIPTPHGNFCSVPCTEKFIKMYAGGLDYGSTVVQKEREKPRAPMPKRFNVRWGKYE